jgi:plastocyanin
MLLAGACANQKKPAAGKSPAAAETVSGKQTYTIAVDHPTPDGKQYQFSAYYPKSLRVRPGDTVVFDNKSLQAIHMVSFGVASDRSNQPPVLLKGAAANPAVFGPCFSTEPPTAAMESCPAAGAAPGASATASPAATARPGAASTAPPPYTGKGYWNSGVLVHEIPGLPNPPPAEARKVTLRLSDSISPGSYRYVCLVHPFMEGTLEVVNKDADRLTPDAVAKAGSEAYELDEAAAGKIAEPQPTSQGTTTTVIAGVSDKVTSINKFYPASVKVKVGDTVAWRDAGPYEPHTVTFQNPFKSPEEPGAYAPGGVASGKPFTGGFSHSGMFGPHPPFPGDSFSLKFTKKGSYAYVCILHPGMGGVVEVE